MLKRNQILLENWQVDYLKFIAEDYDVSFSEATRMLVSMGAIECTSKLFPKYKPKMNLDKLAKAFKSVRSGKATSVESHKIMSEVYFEARKAMEFRMGQKKRRA
ncbi:hypothetical protein ACFL38_02185 [Candidatus Omnitrophota bacterium]